MEEFPCTVKQKSSESVSNIQQSLLTKNHVKRIHSVLTSFEMGSPARVKFLTQVEKYKDEYDKSITLLINLKYKDFKWCKMLYILCNVFRIISIINIIMYLATFKVKDAENMYSQIYIPLSGFIVASSISFFMEKFSNKIFNSAYNVIDILSELNHLLVMCYKSCVPSVVSPCSQLISQGSWYVCTKLYFKTAIIVAVIGIVFQKVFPEALYIIILIAVLLEILSSVSLIIKAILFLINIREPIREIQYCGKAFKMWYKHSSEIKQALQEFDDQDFLYKIFLPQVYSKYVSEQCKDCELFLALSVVFFAINVGDRVNNVALDKSVRQHILENTFCVANHIDSCTRNNRFVGNNIHSKTVEKTTKILTIEGNSTQVISEIDYLEDVSSFSEDKNVGLKNKIAKESAICENAVVSNSNDVDSGNISLGVISNYSIEIDDNEDVNSSQLSQECKGQFQCGKVCEESDNQYLLRCSTPISHSKKIWPKGSFKNVFFINTSDESSSNNDISLSNTDFKKFLFSDDLIVPDISINKTTVFSCPISSSDTSSQEYKTNLHNRIKKIAFNENLCSLLRKSSRFDLLHYVENYEFKENSIYSLPCYLSESDEMTEREREDTFDFTSGCANSNLNYKSRNVKSLNRLCIHSSSCDRFHDNKNNLYDINLHARLGKFISCANFKKKALEESCSTCALNNPCKKLNVSKASKIFQVLSEDRNCDQNNTLNFIDSSKPRAININAVPTRTAESPLPKFFFPVKDSSTCTLKAKILKTVGLDLSSSIRSDSEDTISALVCESNLNSVKEAASCSPGLENENNIKTPPIGADVTFTSDLDDIISNFSLLNLQIESIKSDISAAGTNSLSFNPFPQTMQEKHSDISGSKLSENSSEYQSNLLSLPQDYQDFNNSLLESKGFCPQLGLQSEAFKSTPENPLPHSIISNCSPLAPNSLFTINPSPWKPITTSIPRTSFISMSQTMQNSVNDEGSFDHVSKPNDKQPCERFSFNQGYALNPNVAQQINFDSKACFKNNSPSLFLNSFPEKHVGLKRKEIKICEYDNIEYQCFLDLAQKNLFDPKQSENKQCLINEVFNPNNLKLIESHYENAVDENEVQETEQNDVTDIEMKTVFKDSDFGVQKYNVSPTFDPNTLKCSESRFDKGKESNKSIKQTCNSNYGYLAQPSSHLDAFVIGKSDSKHPNIFSSKCSEILDIEKCDITSNASSIHSSETNHDELICEGHKNYNVSVNESEREVSDLGSVIDEENSDNSSVGSSEDHENYNIDVNKSEREVSELDSETDEENSDNSSVGKSEGSLSAQDSEYSERNSEDLKIHENVGNLTELSCEEILCSFKSEFEKHLISDEGETEVSFLGTIASETNWDNVSAGQNETKEKSLKMKKTERDHQNFIMGKEISNGSTVNESISVEPRNSIANENESNSINYLSIAVNEINQPKDLIRNESSDRFESSCDLDKTNENESFIRERKTNNSMFCVDESEKISTNNSTEEDAVINVQSSVAVSSFMDWKDTNIPDIKSTVESVYHEKKLNFEDSMSKNATEKKLKTPCFQDQEKQSTNDALKCEQTVRHREINHSDLNYAIQFFSTIVSQLKRKIESTNDSSIAETFYSMHDHGSLTPEYLTIVEESGKYAKIMPLNKDPSEILQDNSVSQNVQKICKLTNGALEKQNNTYVTVASDAAENHHNTGSEAVEHIKDDFISRNDCDFYCQLSKVLQCLSTDFLNPDLQYKVNNFKTFEMIEGNDNLEHPQLLQNCEEISNAFPSEDERDDLANFVSLLPPMAENEDNCKTCELKKCYDDVAQPQTSQDCEEIELLHSEGVRNQFADSVSPTFPSKTENVSTNLPSLNSSDINDESFNEQLNRNINSLEKSEISNSDKSCGVTLPSFVLDRTTSEKGISTDANNANESIEFKYNGIQFIFTPPSNDNGMNLNFRKWKSSNDANPTNCERREFSFNYDGDCSNSEEKGSRLGLSPEIYNFNEHNFKHKKSSDG